MSGVGLPAGLFIEAPWPESEAAAWATPDERAAAAAFGSERRRREYLTWRAIVRRELGRGVRIDYDGVGAPVLEDRAEYLSVSHCDGRVAVCISAGRCAVDIEPVTRNFGRVLSRYMTPEEQALADDPQLPAAVWCAKETLYKYAGRRELDLLHDLRILEADFAAGRLVGSIAGGEPVSMSLLRREEYLVTFIL